MANDSSGDLLTEVQEIRAYMKKMNRRDSLRTWGGFFRSTVTFGLVLYGAWFLVQNWQNIINEIAVKSAEQATASMNKQLETLQEKAAQGQDILRQFQGGEAQDEGTAE